MIHRLSALGLFVALTAAPALAQEGSSPTGGAGILGQLLFFIPLILIFYFLLIRPQQQQRKRQQEMIANLKKGDTVVTYGGLIGRLTKISDEEVTVELADNVRVRVARSMISAVRNKSEPVAAND